MKKAQAIELLGGTVKACAAACGITPSAVSQWPDDLSASRDIEDRVLAALARKHLAIDQLKPAVEAPGEPAAEVRDAA